MKSLALLAIRLYRRYLSPRKGFGCAHRVLAGGESCSAYGYRVIERHGVAVGVRLLRRRLAACGQLYRRHRIGTAPATVRLRANRQAGFCDACDVPSCDLPCHCHDCSGPCDMAANVAEGVGGCRDCSDIVKRWRAGRDDGDHMVDIRPHRHRPG